jgi:parallel beta-helix repeat protein
LNKTGGSEVITAKSAELVVAGSKFIGSCLDTRDRSTVRSVRNVFQSSSMIISGDSNVDSLNDRFTGEALACVGVSGSANLFLHNVELADVTGNALVVYEDARLQVEHGTIRNCQRHAVMAHSGGRLRLSDVAITRVKGFGVRAAHPQEASFTRVVLKECESTGFEITSATSCQLDDVKISGESKVGLGLFKSTATINRSEFSGNAFAGCHFGTSTATLIGCKFDQNAKGGVIGVQASKIGLHDCEFRRNGWVGVYVDPNSTCDANHTVFQGNAAGATIAGDGHFRNSDFAGNQTFGLQSTGDARLDKCSFEQEPTGIVVGEGGRIRVVACNFKDNRLHVEATQHGVATIEETTFLAATGGCGVHTGEAAVTIRRCIFDHNTIGLVSEGETNVLESHFVNSAQYAVMFSGNARGEIKASKFEKNGECAFHCLDGKPKILGNTVTDHEKFGIYIFPRSTPIVEDNQFKNNGMANIWRGA